jgi:hypothetical protein
MERAPCPSTATVGNVGDCRKEPPVSPRVFSVDPEHLIKARVAGWFEVSTASKRDAQVGVHVREKCKRCKVKRRVVGKRNAGTYPAAVHGGVPRLVSGPRILADEAPFEDASNGTSVFRIPALPACELILARQFFGWRDRRDLAGLLILRPFGRCGEARHKLTAQTPAVSDLDAPVREATAVSQTRDHEFGRSACGYGPQEIDVEGVEGELRGAGRQKGRATKSDAPKTGEEGVEGAISSRFATQQLGERIQGWTSLRHSPS